MLDFDHLVTVQNCYDIAFDWPEKDRNTPRQSLEKFKSLTGTDRQSLAQSLVAPVLSKLKSFVQAVIESELTDTTRRISSVEVLLKTDQNEMLLLQYESVSTAISGMTAYISDEKIIHGKGFYTMRASPHEP